LGVLVGGACSSGGSGTADTGSGTTIVDTEQGPTADDAVTAVAEAARCTDLHLDTGQGAATPELAAMAHGRCRAPGLTVEAGLAAIADGFRLVGDPQVADTGAWAVQGIGDPMIGDGPVDTVELLWVADDGGLLSITVNGPLPELDAEDGWRPVPAPTTTAGGS